MRALALVVLLAGVADASPASLLANAPACHPVAGPFSVLGQAIGQQAAEAITNGPTALGQMGGAIDSTMAVLGPIFLDHAQTIGQGKLNLNVLGQTDVLGRDEGISLDPPTTQTVVFGPPVVAARLTYDARIRQAAIGLAATYGLLDQLDVSLLFPLVYTDVAVTATRQVTDVLGPGGRFVPVKGQPVVTSSEHASSFAQGDLTVRAKYAFAEHWAALLSFQFPTGVPELLTGTGHYWIDPSVVVAYGLPMWRGMEVGGSLGMLIDLSEPSFSKIAYGVSASAVLIPERLGFVLEVFGQSEVAARLNSEDTAVLTLLSNRTVAQQPALNLFITRDDQVNLSTGFRAPLLAVGSLTLMLFITAVVPLNQQGLRPSGAFVTLGMGGTL
jgi:hypothetical protein